MNTTRDWAVPLLRQVIAGLVGMLMVWLAKHLGIEVTEHDKGLMVDGITGLGLALWAIVAATVAKQMKSWFLRGWHPGRNTFGGSLPGKPYPLSRGGIL